MKENTNKSSHKNRDSMKVAENSLIGKMSYREDISRKSSSKIKLTTFKPLETDRNFQQINNIIGRKSIIHNN